MIIITSRLFDVASSPLILNETPASSALRTVTRRVTRTATLDGGAAIDDAGFSDGDRTFTIAVEAPSAQEYGAILAFIEGDGIQRVATRDGVFEGSIESAREQGGKAVVIKFVVREKLSA